jgi:hypothetical protein
MRTFLVLICSLALACGAGGAQEENKSKKPAPKKKQVQSTQHAATPSGGQQYHYHPTVIRQYPVAAQGGQAAGKPTTAGSVAATSAPPQPATPDSSVRSRHSARLSWSSPSQLDTTQGQGKSAGGKKKQTQSAQPAATPITLRGADGSLYYVKPKPSQQGFGRPIRDNQRGTHTGAVTEYGVTDKGAHGSQKTKGLHMSGSSPYVTLRGADGNSLAKPTPSPHGYVGRNDGRVQQSTAYDKPVLNPIIFDPHGVPAAKPTGGKPAESQQPAGGKKKSQKVSPTPRPR